MNVRDEFPEFINSACFAILLANGTFRQFILLVTNVGQAVQDLPSIKKAG